MRKFLFTLFASSICSLLFAQFVVWSNGEILFQVENDKVDSITLYEFNLPEKDNYTYDSVYLYGNCTDPLNNREDGRFGMNASYTMSTATMLSGADLAAHGTKIIGVRALIDGEVSDAEVYVAGSLDMSDILTRKSFEWVDEGWQYVLFDEPLDITGSDLYVGYTITSSGFVIGLEPASKMTSTEYMYWNNQWFKLSDMGTKGYWSIQVILQGGDYSAETQLIDTIKVECVAEEIY